MILQIAAGIVTAVIVLRFWRQISTLLLLAGAAPAWVIRWAA